MSIPVLRLFVAAALLCPVGIAAAQCTPQWVPGIGTVNASNGIVNTLTVWDPDGPGPQTAKVVIGGQFNSMGGVPAVNITTWDPATGQWAPLGAGLTNPSGGVFSLATSPAGDLYAGGNFYASGSTQTYNVARWNGSAWVAVGPPIFNVQIDAMCVLNNGDLVIAGGFAAGTTDQHLTNIARWNGSAWVSVGWGVGAGSPSALVKMSNGDMVAGGNFINAINTGGSAFTSRGVAKWNGTVWSPMGSGTPNHVYCLAVMPNGDVIAGGDFTSMGGSAMSCIARWHGSTWSALGTGISGAPVSQFPSVNAVAALPDGSVIAAGFFTNAGGVSVNNIARWNGTSWSAMTTGLQTGTSAAAFARALTVLPNNNVIVGGSFALAGGQTAYRIGRYDPGICPGPTCDSIDFNGDGLFPDTQDIDDFLSVFSGGPCSTGTCGDVDFNNDGLFPDTLDIDSMLSVFSGGACL